MTAKIGETLCATGVPGYPTGGPPPPWWRPIYQLTVPAEEELPGCGREGAVVTFFVNGQQVPQTAIWHSGEVSPIMSVIIGPPFARFSGAVRGGTVSPGQVILPYVGNTACGRGEAEGPPGYGYEAVVYSTQEQGGCGVEGSVITFKLLDAQGNVIAVANQTAVWHAWDGISDPQRLDLTFGPAGFITMPGTGTGTGSGSNAWGRLSLALGVAGLAGVAGGLAVRRRVLQRRR